ncbi:unnamed protein product [Eruca vesicaria subsp. sativa]|uniref:Uncharacterized protein n=1 Tax=Eruca vesicaria subsp. sativa TaxID=29727 RepID=A0ABC8J784_ERUVS|nr:unnamed protein product [Eruca vesicaria subsp. sativa]
MYLSVDNAIVKSLLRVIVVMPPQHGTLEQLNRGFVPELVDVHCLAGLNKAWFIELRTSVLDSLSPKQVMQCQIEEEYVELVRLLPPAEASLLYWAINLVADIDANREKTQRERQDSIEEEAHVFPLEPSDESSSQQSPSQSLAFNTIEQSEELQADYVKNAKVIV